MPTTRFQLVEALPYPRAEHTGRLIDRNEARLHGAYERQSSGGSTAALINNGTDLARWPTHWPARRNPFPSTRHSFTNLIHTCSKPEVSADCRDPSWPAET